MEWKTIDSVPKSGKFDVWGKYWNFETDKFIERRFTDCHWRLKDPMGQWQDGIVGVDKGWRSTHWMPLPPPPKDE